MLKQKFKNLYFIKIFRQIINIFKSQYSIFKKTMNLLLFFFEYSVFSKKNNPQFVLSLCNIYPKIFDKTKKTPLNVDYFYQNTWLAKKIFTEKPKNHYDIGSQVNTIGILSQFTPITMIDIRPINIDLHELLFKEGNILELPLESNSISSLSSMCVIEHIGLGRYGDNLDPFGSEKAIKELIRVLSPKGNLYISVPVDTENLVYFNAHRAFTKKYLLELFSPLIIVEEKYIYNNKLYNDYDKLKGFGIGMFHLRKS